MKTRMTHTKMVFATKFPYSVLVNPTHIEPKPEYRHLSHYQLPSPKPRRPQRTYPTQQPRIPNYPKCPHRLDLSSRHRGRQVFSQSGRAIGTRILALLAIRAILLVTGAAVPESRNVRPRRAARRFAHNLGTTQACFLGRRISHPPRNCLEFTRNLRNPSQQC